jgi:hypothetical protein
MYVAPAAIAVSTEVSAVSTRLWIGGTIGVVEYRSSVP